MSPQSGISMLGSAATFRSHRIRTIAAFRIAFLGGSMEQAWLGRIATKVLMVAMLAAGAPMGVAAQGADDIAALNRQALQLYGQGKYKEGATVAEKALAAAERELGKEHPDTLASVNNLAALYRAQGRYLEAEPLLERTLEVRERVLGKEHPDTLASVNNLAALYDSQGRYPEAEPLHKRALEARERVLTNEGVDLAEVVGSLLFLASMLLLGSRIRVRPALERSTPDELHDCLK
jgi:tetratricopeptide (TPR) repeat protein